MGNEILIDEYYAFFIISLIFFEIVLIFSLYTNNYKVYNSLESF